MIGESRTPLLPAGFFDLCLGCHQCPSWTLLYTRASELDGAQSLCFLWTCTSRPSASMRRQHICALCSQRAEVVDGRLSSCQYMAHSMAYLDCSASSCFRLHKNRADASSLHQEVQIGLIGPAGLAALAARVNQRSPKRDSSQDHAEGASRALCLRCHIACTLD